MSDDTPRRRPGNPALVPGCASLNPSGRSKLGPGIARQIAAATRDGEDLVEFVLGVWKDPESSPRQRWQALEWLTDRGAGKAMQASEVSLAIDAAVGSAGAPRLPADWTELTGSERHDWLREHAPLALARGGGS